VAKSKNVRPLWYVQKIVLEEDRNKEQIVPGDPGQVQDEVQLAAPRAQARNQVPEDVAPRAARTSGYGFHLLRDDIVKLAFTTEDAAKDYAEEQASKNPKVAYGVFGCLAIFETTKPEIIKKTFNESGELVVIPTEEKKDEVRQVD